MEPMLSVAHLAGCARIAKEQQVEKGSWQSWDGAWVCRMEDARGSTPEQDGCTHGVRVKLLTSLLSSTPLSPFCSPPVCPDLSLVYIRSSSKPLLCRPHSLTQQQTFSRIYFIFFFLPSQLNFCARLSSTIAWRRR